MAETWWSTVRLNRVVLGQWLRMGGEGAMPAMLDQALAFIGNGLGVDTA